jgi:SpoVK/Ycf46/Vps4 family AAA+-type ATPase
MADDTESGFAEGCTLKIVIPPESAGKAREWIKNLREVAARDYDPIRGKIVEIAAVGGDVRPRIIETPRGSLSDVVVEDRVLAELGRNILDHISSIDALKKAGLGSNRGVLLWGPPGTGKTSLVRGLINQLEGKATILIPNSHAIADALNLVYDDAVRLAPSVVVLEDIDVVAGKRSRQNSNLAGFLASLDGVISDPGSMVVTIATTNDPAGIDDAAKRPGRIDKFLEVPLPDQSLREKILRQYLNKLQEGDLTVEVGNGAVNALARNSEGASGAMLREVVRRALLIAHCSNGNKLDDACLAAGAEEIGYSSVQTGQYL